MKFRISIYVLFLTALATCAPAARAQTYGSPSSGGRSQWQAMRQEMMGACADKTAGTTCSFSHEGQPVSGTCRAMRRGKLVCLTATQQEMMAACADKSAGTACSFSREGQAVSGTCRATRQGQLVCRAGKGGGGRGMHGQMGGGMPGGGMPPGNAPEQWHALWKSDGRGAKEGVLLQNRARPLKIEGLSIEALVRLDLFAPPASLLIHLLIFDPQIANPELPPQRVGHYRHWRRIEVGAPADASDLSPEGKGALRGARPSAWRRSASGHDLRDRLAHRAMQLAVAREDLACVKIQC